MTLATRKAGVRLIEASIAATRTRSLYGPAYLSSCVVCKRKIFANYNTTFADYPGDRAVANNYKTFCADCAKAQKG